MDEGPNRGAVPVDMGFIVASLSLLPVLRERPDVANLRPDRQFLFALMIFSHALDENAAERVQSRDPPSVAIQLVLLLRQAWKAKPGLRVEQAYRNAVKAAARGEWRRVAERYADGVLMSDRHGALTVRGGVLHLET